MNHDHFRTTRRLANLRQGRNDWYRIENKSDGPALVHIYDEIGFFGVTAQDFVNDLSGIKGEIELHINSPGGDVFDGLAIYNALAQRKAAVMVVVDGLAASAASFIAQAASPGQLVMAKNANLMIHDAFGMGIGNAGDMRELAGLLDKQSDNIAAIYAERSGKPAGHWREQMQAETWYVGQEAVDAGLADRVQGGKSETRDNWDLSVFGRPPAAIQNADAEPAEPQIKPDDQPADQWDGRLIAEALKGAQK